MSQDLTQEQIADGTAAVEQVVEECRAAGVVALEEWLSVGQDTSMALRDVAQAIVDTLVREYALDVD